MKMNKMLKIAATLAVMGAAAQANASASVIYIDPDGAGSAGTIGVTSLNWLAGNVITVGAGGTAGQSAAAFSASLANGTAVLQSYYQAQLNTFVYNPSGSSSIMAPIGQWTVQASFQERATATALGAVNISLTPISGTVSIFYNATAVANDVTGTGYNAGTEILRGTITGGSGTFQNTTFLNDFLVSIGVLPSNPTPITNLDQFGANDAPGVTTIQGNGQSSLTVDIGATAGDFIDTNFFKTDITTLMIDANDSGQLVAPFQQANPSDSVLGYTPVYGAGNVNGTAAPVNGLGIFTQNSDIQFQTTNVTSFVAAVPEPGSLALIGAGAFGALASLRRRKAK